LDPNVSVIGLTQDSDPKNKKAQKKPKKTQGAGLKYVDNIVLYFEPPFQGKDEVSVPFDRKHLLLPVP
jgi:hypothetical protein